MALRSPCGETDSADTRGRKLRDYLHAAGATRENPTGCSRGSVNSFVGIRNASELLRR